MTEEPPAPAPADQAGAGARPSGRPDRGRVLAVVGLLLGLVLLSGGVLQYVTSGRADPSPVGTSLVVESRLAADGNGPGDDLAIHGRGVARRSPVPVGSFEPIRVELPSLGVSAPVTPVGTRPDGQMEVPRDPSVVGWWNGSAQARAGSAHTVLAGHIFNKGYGAGAFFRIGEIAVGAPAIVAGADGRTATYAVTAVERVAKSDFPADRIFTFDGPHRLVLVTCGGTFDRSTGHYRDNIVVYAEPA